MLDRRIDSSCTIPPKPYKSRDSHPDRPRLRRPRTYSYLYRRTVVFRVDFWLSSLAPATLRPWILTIPYLPTLLLVYSLLCIFVLSGFLTSCPLPGFFKSPPPTDGVSELERIPVSHLLSKVSSIRPSPTTLIPGVLSTRLEDHPLAACIWVDDSEIEMVPSWAARWTGPISVLVTTAAPPQSRAHRVILSKLAEIHENAATHPGKLVTHVLHLHPSTEPQPNAFLNIARLLSPSPHVVLFPGNITSAPPRNLYRTLLAQHSPSAFSSALMSPLRSDRARKRRATVLTQRGRMSFPFSPGAPLVLARDDPVWCTERALGGVPREADWEQCLWQVWLASFGDLEIRQAHGWVTLSGRESVNRKQRTTNVVAENLRNRLVERFRRETCVLAMRRFAAVRDMGSSTDTKRARWLKRICRSSMLA